MKKAAKKPSALKRLMKNATGKEKMLIPLCVAYSLSAALVPFLNVLLPKVLIQEISLPTPTLNHLLVIVAGYFLLSGGFGFLTTLLFNSSYPKLTSLRLDYVRDASVKIMDMDYPYTEDATFLDKYENAFSATSSNDNGVEGIYHKLFEMPANIIIVLALAVLVGIKSPIILIAILINIAATAFAATRVQKYNYSLKEDLAKHQRRVAYYSRASQDFTYGKDVRLYSLKDRILYNFKQEINGYIDVFRLVRNKEYRLSFLTLLTLLISDGATYGILIYLAFSGMPIADFSMYLVAATTLSLTLTALSQQLTFIFQEYMYVQDMYEFLDADLGQDGGTLPAVPKGQSLEIEFRSVTFHYPNTDKNVYTNFSLHIPTGQKLALVGINGAGKTTFVKLLTGLYKVNEGEILINGKNIDAYNKQELYTMFSVVFQDVNVLAFTVAENIAGTSKDIDYRKVEDALGKVNLLDKVESLAKGMDHTMLKIIDEDGAIFSGGENQKLTIARALYKDANMVIMDEPTSALDALAEAEIYQQFDELTKGKTAIYISHRLASTKFCDKIALIDGDGLREYGSHHELMAAKGPYYDMFMTQGKYYREEGACNE